MFVVAGRGGVALVAGVFSLVGRATADVVLLTTGVSGLVGCAKTVELDVVGLVLVEVEVEVTNGTPLRLLVVLVSDVDCTVVRSADDWRVEDCNVVDEVVARLVVPALLVLPASATNCQRPIMPSSKST